MPLFWATAPLELNLPIQRRTFSHLVIMMHKKKQQTYYSAGRCRVKTNTVMFPLLNKKKKKKVIFPQLSFFCICDGIYIYTPRVRSIILLLTA